MKYMPWGLAAIASWLIAAPFVLGYANADLAMHNDIAVGVVTLLGALYWGFSGLREHGMSTGMQAHRH